MEADVEGLTAFRDCLLNPTLGLTTVDLLYNRIGSASYMLEFTSYNRVGSVSV
jgi:hypothetical protein